LAKYTGLTSAPESKSLGPTN